MKLMFCAIKNDSEEYLTLILCNKSRIRLNKYIFNKCKYCTV